MGLKNPPKTPFINFSTKIPSALYEASKLANQISNQDDQIQDLRSKFDHQEEVIADYKTRIESCTGELDTQRNMYNDLRDRMGYEIQQKDEECNQREQDAERHCSDKVNTKNEEVQQYGKCLKTLFLDFFLGFFTIRVKICGINFWLVSTLFV